MATVGSILYYVAAVVQLVCFILVLIKIFQSGQTGLGIACAVLACCGIGFLIVFIYGWVKSREWGITNIMTIWSAAWVLGIVGAIMNPGVTQIQIPQTQSVR
jgi:hypothetical protein